MPGYGRSNLLRSYISPPLLYIDVVSVLPISLGTRGYQLAFIRAVSLVQTARGYASGGLGLTGIGPAPLKRQSAYAPGHKLGTGRFQAEDQDIMPAPGYPVGCLHHKSGLA